MGAGSPNYYAVGLFGDSALLQDGLNGDAPWRPPKSGMAMNAWGEEEENLSLVTHHPHAAARRGVGRRARRRSVDLDVAVGANIPQHRRLTWYIPQ